MAVHHRLHSEQKQGSWEIQCICALCLPQAATLVDGAARLVELGVRHGDLLFVQNSAEAPGLGGAPAARGAEGGVAALPDHLRRVLAEAGPVTCPHYALLLAAHAALLESGLEPAWPVQTFAVPASLPRRSWVVTTKLGRQQRLPAQRKACSGCDKAKHEPAGMSIVTRRLACYRQVHRWPPRTCASIATNRGITAKQAD